jgi:uncharacterized protein
MNEQLNTALIQKLYDAFGKGDMNTILGTLADDVDWTMEGPAIIPYSGKRKGIAETTKFFEALGTTQTDQKLTLETFVAQGDVVATFGRYSATVKATGKKFDSPVAHFFTIRAGKIAKFVDVVDTASMAEAYRGAAAAGR